MKKAKGAAAPRKAPSVERIALIRLLWRSVADGDGCGGDCEDYGEAALDICCAMRALGWGRHWKPHTFERRAIQEASKASARSAPMKGNPHD